MKWTRRLFCEWLGWHNGGSNPGFRGPFAMSVEGRCSRCHRRVLQCTMGDWFPVAENHDKT